MAFAPDRVEPVFGDALAGDGGMTEPVATGPRREGFFDVFPDALSAEPLAALSFVAPGADADGVPARLPGTPGLVVATTRAPARPSVGRAPNRPGATPRPAPPAGPAWSGYPPPGQPFAVQPPPTPAGRRSVAGVAYAPPPTTASTVIRPPAYLPQNPGLAGLRAAAQQVRSGGRAPASPPSAVRPAPPTGRRRSNRASSIWALFVFALIFLVSSGIGQNILDALSRLLHHR